MRRYIISAAVLAVGVLVFVGAGLARKASNKVHPPASWTGVFTETWVPRNGGAIIPKGIRTRFERPGEWKEFVTSFDKEGRIRERVDFANGTGAYQLAAQADKMDLISGNGMRPTSLSANDLRNHPQFHGESKVLGYPVYILRDQNPGDEASDIYIDNYCNPQFGWTALKMVNHTSPTEEIVIEAISLTVGDVPDWVFNAPSVPVSYDLMRQKIEALEKRGNFKAADALKKQLMDRK